MSITVTGKKTGFKKNLNKLINQRQYYYLLIPVLAYFVIFRYWPMYGAQIAFRDYSATRGIWGSNWVGMKHFIRFFNSYFFSRLLFNTLGISFYQLAVGFPMPIILAICINEISNRRFQRVVQTVTYAPHFLSVVVLVGMLNVFLTKQTGLINNVIDVMGGRRHEFLTDPGWFKSLYVLSGVWQNMGWNAIIYLAALTGIDPNLHEAAMIDGANKFKRILNVSLPGIKPTIIILLILNSGQLMNVGFEKAFLMQNDLNISSSDVISTYVYRAGLLQTQYSFSAAVGLFNSVINLALLLTVNKISRTVTESGLW